MENKIETQSMLIKASTQMRAVLTVFSADEYLMKIVEPHLDVKNDSIKWDCMQVLT